MSHQFYPNNRSNSRRLNFGAHQHFPRKPTSNFTDNFTDFPHNSTMLATMNKPRVGPYLNRSFSNVSSFSSASEKPSFSSLFSDSNGHRNSDLFHCDSSSPISDDDDGVYLQISNLDQWYDEANLRNYLMTQLKPITPILSLTIETPSIAKVKVPSIQFAKQVVSHLHRKKMGHKRIFVSFMRDKTSAECSALRNKVVGLLKDVPSHQLPMSKFRELFQSRFKSSISILDLYRMPDICTISVNIHEEKVIELQPEVILEQGLMESTDQHSAPYCIHHFKPDKNKGWAEIEIDPLPNVTMSIAQVRAIILPLLRVHQGDIPIASILYCLEAEMKITIQPNDRGISLEHLVSCVPGVVIKNNDYGIKILAWSNDSNSDSIIPKANLIASNGEAADNISKEVIELIKMCKKSTMMFSKFIPTYHNHFGKQCRVADYGCTKLIEMFEAMSNIVQILGDGETRQITLTHQTQIRRFSSDVFKILRAQPNKTLYLSMLPQLFLQTHNKIFDVTDYGVNDMEDLLDGLRNNSFIVVTKKREESDDVCIFIQKRRLTNIELEKSAVFAGEVVELLRSAPQYMIPFRKFVRSYHYYFGYQCKLSDYGFMRLAELLESLSGIVEMDQNNEENRKIFLSRKVALRVFSEQIHEVMKEMAGLSGLMIRVDDVLEQHKEKFGYQILGPSLGYETVIDAMKFVPFIELSSYDNELWIISHIDNEKFRQRSMLASLTIVDIGNKVAMSKFHGVFLDRFKFNINEKSLHAMKHAVEIEMVNGVKMITNTLMMKFIIHAVNLIQQKKKMNIQEIKAAMKLSVSTTFAFGYPNVSTLILAFPDIFKVDSSVAGDKSMIERFDIELNPNCPLILSGLKDLLNKKQVQLQDEKNEFYYKPKLTPIGVPPNMKCISKPAPSSVMNQQSFLQDMTDKAHRQSYSDFYQRGNPFSGDMTLSQTMPTSLLNHMMNCSQQQQRFPSNPYNESNESFYERNLKFNQHMQAMKVDNYNNSRMSTASSSSSSLSAYESQMQQNYSMMMQTPSTSFFNRFDPPKPDTPPNKPLWLDPVWNCDGNFFDSRNSNGSNVKGSYGNSDLVVSPFGSFKTMFTFENADQKSNSNNGYPKN